MNEEKISPVDQLVQACSDLQHIRSEKAKESASLATARANLKRLEDVVGGWEAKEAATLRKIRNLSKEVG